MIVAGAAVALAAVFIRAMLAYNHDRPGAPVDDAYIYFNYAKRLAEGYFFQYNPGDGMSTGATSWLWTAILAIGYKVGFRGDNIIYWANGLGVVFLVAYALLLFRLGRRIFGHRALAALTAILVLLDGRVLWGFFSCMEIGLFTLALIATVETWMLYRARPSRGGFAALVASLSCLVLVRPEGQVLGLMASLAFATHTLLRRPPPGFSRLRALLRDRRMLVLMAVPVALIAATYAILLIKSGSVAQNGMRTKSHLFAPDQNVFTVLTESGNFFRDMLLTHFPWYFDTIGKALFGLFVFTGLLVGAAREAAAKRPGVLLICGAWFVGGLALQSLVLNAAYHHGRYVMNYSFIYWLCFAAGLWRWLRWHRIPLPAKRLAAGGALAIAATMMVGSVPVFRHNFGNDVRTIQAQHGAMAKYIREHVPQDASVGMNDVGVMAYHGGRYVVDVWGLTTNALAARKWEGQACILEELKHMAPEGAPRRPTHFAIYPSWYNGIVALGFLDFITKFHVPPPHINGADDLALYSVDWDALLDDAVPHGAKGELARASMRVVDAMDVAYRRSEIAHGYEHHRDGKPSAWGSDLMRFTPYAGEGTKRLVEGGRVIREQESWTAQNLTPGRELWIVRRTSGGGDACEVLIDGRPAGQWEPSTDAPGRFRDDIFRVPGDLVTGSSARLTFVLKRKQDERTGLTRRLGSYDVFHYWVAQ